MEWVKKAWEIKRKCGVSWTKIQGELLKTTGYDIPNHKIRDAIRIYEVKNNLIEEKEDMSLVLNINDVHIGKRTSSYNSEIALTKMEYLFNELLEEYKTLKRKYKISEIHINFIGDIIDNDTLYPTQPHHVDKRTGEVSNSTRQIKFATEIFKDLIDKLQKNTKINICINAVRGNHGRISKFTEETNNYDVMFYDRLELALNDNKKVIFNTTDDFYIIVDIQKHGFLLNHGNGIKMYQNIPWYGLTQKTMRWEGSMPKKFDYIIVGHFHTFGEQAWNDKRIFLNGTSVSDDSFPIEFLGLKGINSFWCFGVTKNNGIKHKREIDMEEV